jgi:hypothetical protein
MTRPITRLAAVVVLLASVAAGFGAWTLVRKQGPPLPQISAYSHGKVVRVDPYLYCNVLNLDDCVKGGAEGQLSVNGRDPVQLSVPARIGNAPWRLLRVYSNEDDTVATAYRPGTALAVTVPTVDPRRGKIVGLVVQLLTLVRDQNGDLHDLPHAEWSIRLSWTTS